MYVEGNLHTAPSIRHYKVPAREPSFSVCVFVQGPPKGTLEIKKYKARGDEVAVDGCAVTPPKKRWYGPHVDEAHCRGRVGAD